MLFFSVSKVGESAVFANFCSISITTLKHIFTAETCMEMRFLPQVNKALLYLMKSSKSLETKSNTCSVSRKVTKKIHS